MQGIPAEVRDAILSAGLKEDDVMQNPELARDILYKLSLRDVLKYGVESPEISKPSQVTHLVSVTFNKDTGKFEVCSRFVFVLHTRVSRTIS